MNCKLLLGRTNFDSDDRCEVWAGLEDLISYCFEAVLYFPVCSTHQSSGPISSSPSCGAISSSCSVISSSPCGVNGSSLSFTVSISLTPLIDAVKITSYSFA
jgi:hypothetical protein